MKRANGTEHIFFLFWLVYVFNIIIFIIITIIIYVMATREASREQRIPDGWKSQYLYEEANKL